LTNIEPITLERLLEEMTDLTALTRCPRPKYRIAHCSSYNRASVTPEDPEGWFANEDTGPFIRQESNGGRVEHVIAEFNGPGCLSRLWTPDRRIHPYVANRSEETAIVRVYLDGNETPAVEGLFQDVFNGTGIFMSPFAHKSLSSAISYFPVPFADGLKITLEGEPFYYNISARMYEPGTRVESFSPELMGSLSNKIADIGKRLAGSLSITNDTTGGEFQLDPGCEEAIFLSGGPQAISGLCLTMDTMAPTGLRGSVVRLSFDEEETVYCPLSEFFGCGPGLHPFESLTRSVDQSGSMRFNWVMPYQKHATIKILNLDSIAHTYNLQVGTAPYLWDERSHYFHADWRYTYPLPTRPRSDWNYLSVRGQGHYVGDTLTVHNPVEIWWGEGDEKIWVDDDDFPSIFGTGTEDYYGYSWGGRSRAFYEHPMHAQVRVDKYDKNGHNPIPEARNTKGISTELRNLVLDSVTFETRLKYDMEIWHWAECKMAYAVACFWYGAAGATSNTTANPAIVKHSMEDLLRFENQD